MSLEAACIGYLVSILASFTAGSLKKGAGFLSKKIAERDAALQAMIKEFREQDDWTLSIRRAWSGALSVTDIADDELAIALNDEGFVAKVFENLTPEKLAPDLVDSLLEERKNSANLQEFTEEKIRKITPAVCGGFLNAVSEDENLKFKFFVSQHQEILAEIRKLQKAEKPFDADAYIDGILDNEEEFVWQDAVYIPLDVEKKADPKDKELRRTLPSVADFLQTVTKYQHSTLPGEEKERSDRTESMPLMEAIEKHRKLVILGEPGAGKSLSLRHLVVELARKRKNNPDLPIPVLIELRNFGIRGKDLTALISDRLDWYVAKVGELLESESFALFLDGLNEIASNHTRDALSAVQEFFGGDHQCYATSRLVGYSDDIPAETMQIEPLHEDQIRDFISNYLRQLGSERTQEDVFDAIKDEERLFDLASNPLMLMMMTSVMARPEHPGMPKSRGQLFERLVKYIHERDCDRDMCKLSVDQWTGLLGPLAYTMIDSGGVVSIEKEQCMKILKEAHDNMVASGQLSPLTHGDLYSNYNEILSSGLLRAKGDTIEFQHQLFQEYFAACELKSRGIDWLLENIQDFLEYSLWDEVLLNLLALIELEKAEGFISRISEWDIFFACKCLRYLPTLSEEVEAQIIEKIKEVVLSCKVLSIRSTAARALAEMHRICAEELLLQFLLNSDDGIRHSAAHAFSTFGTEKAVEGLIEALGDSGDPNIGMQAALAIREIKSIEKEKLLIGAMDSPNPHSRAMAALALGRPVSVLAERKLIELLDDANGDVQFWAILELGMIKSEKASEKLIELTDDFRPNISRTAADALGKIGTENAIAKLFELLIHPDSEMRTIAALRLGKMKSRTVEHRLIEELNNSNPGVRVGAVFALGEMRAKHLETELVGLLDDSDEGVCSSAANALERIASENSEGRLIEKLNHPSSRIRGSMAHALGKMRSKRAEEKLISLLDDQSPDVRARAAIALGEMGCLKAESKLIAMLRSEDTDICWAAATALGHIRSEKAVDMLIEMTNALDEKVRKPALNALGMIASQSAISRLIELLGSSNLDIQFESLHAFRASLRVASRSKWPAIAEIIMVIFHGLDASNSDAKHSLYVAISNFRDATKRRYLDIFGPNFGLGFDGGKPDA